MNKVLNVGGNNKSIALPSHYAGWSHILLDIDAKGNPDIVHDARQLTPLPASEYDAVYCSGNLEIVVFAFKNPPSDAAIGLLKLPVAR